MYSRIENIKIAGIASAIPRRIFNNLSDGLTLFDADIVDKIVKNTGIKKRPISSNDVCASDLCFSAAERLLSVLDWSPQSVNLLVFVTQTPDHRLPATACILQDRLHLPKSCAVFDINQGCTGYVYGLWLTASLLYASDVKRALLLVGDTITKIVSPADRSTALLFGDAGTATALEKKDGSKPVYFSFGTDGSGADQLIVPAGGFRMRCSPETAKQSVREAGNSRSDEDLYMNGAEVFAFTLRELPRFMASTFEYAQISTDNLDYVIPHQANRSILKYLCTSAHIPEQKVVLDLEDFGNTSSASIPLAITNRLCEIIQTSSKNLFLIGFGVGWSWASAIIEMGPLKIPPLISI